MTVEEMCTRYFVLEMVTYSHPGATPLPTLPYADDVPLFETEDAALAEIRRLEDELAEGLAAFGQTLAYSVTRHVASVRVPAVAE